MYSAERRVGRGNLVLRHSVPYSAKFWKHYVLSGGSQRRVLLQHQSEEMKILNISFPRVGIEPTTSQPPMCPCATSGLKYTLLQFAKKNF